MTADLTLYGREVATVFDLLGDKENDITYAIGWALANSQRFSGALLKDVLPRRAIEPPESIRLQEGVSGAGFTDIEIQGRKGKLHVVIEAKRGYQLPSHEQLSKYASRTIPPPTLLVALAEAPPEFVAGKLPKKVDGVRVLYRSWRQIERLVSEARAGSRRHAERHLLGDLSRYLKGLMTMQNVGSNMVYVVSLGREIEETGISFRDVVVNHDTYFCPIGGSSSGWPKEPPNYLGFRFDGKLQQVRHVDDYRVTDDNYAGFKPLRGKVNWPDERHWNFRLGPVIKPMAEVRTGNLFRAQRVWVAIDLLLTSKTIAEARDKTRIRLEGAGESL